MLESRDVLACHLDFIDIAQQWQEVAELFDIAGESGAIKYINEASRVLVGLSEKEKATMEKLVISCA